MTSPAAIQRGLQAFKEAQELHARKQYREATAAYNRALALMPNHPGVLVAFGQMAHEVQDWKASETLHRRLVDLRPAENYRPRLAYALLQLGRYDEAIAQFELCVAVPDPDPDLYLWLANCMSCANRWDDAIACARRAWQIRPEAKYLDAELINLFQLGRDEELDRRIDEAYARYPDSPEIRSLYALHKLKSGRDYAGGFALLDDMRWRNNAAQPVPNLFDALPHWDGHSFPGTLRIVADAGLGDQILGSSLFGDVIALDQRAQVICEERLLPLFRRSFPGIDFLPDDADGRSRALAETDAGADRRCNAIDLARFFRRDRAAFPARRAWLHADPARAQAIRDRYRARWPGKTLVGISWKSVRVMESGAFKGIALAALAPLLARADCAFVNLQYGNVAEEIDTLRAQTGINLYVDPEIDSTRDIDGLAAQISALDHVVSTSNTTVHVAGALGIRCRVLLPKTRPVLWYWGYHGNDTPWYPSLELLRSDSDSDWTAFIAQVARMPLGQ